MSVLASLSARTIILFLVTLVGQVGGGILLPRTDAFRDLGWSLVCIAVYGVSFWALATMIREGAPLSVVMPALAATVPLAVIFIAALFMGEPASLMRIGILSGACLLIGIASTV